MARRPRIDLGGVAQHVVQRGNDRSACFAGIDDFRTYLGALREAAIRHGCAIHAYVLMTNHVHLLLTPAEMGAVSRLMQALGRKYVRHFNDTHQRTGTLWEGRFRSNLVDTTTYALACHRYIELNPVRAGMVAAPAEYPWSSFQGNTGLRPDPLLTPHPAYLALGDSTRRTFAYRRMVDAGTPDEERERIRTALSRQHALGASDFCADVEARLGRPVGPGRPGRPRREIAL